MRRFMITAAAAAAVIGLAGCTSEVPTVSAAPSPEYGAAVVESQAERILPETFAELAAADEALDAALLTARVTGDAKTVRAAQYKQAKAKDGPAPQQIPATAQAVYVSGEEDWPRMLVAVTEQPTDELTPMVMLWIQQDVDSDYKLQAWSHMIPGATLPAMAGPATGAAQLTLASTDVEPTAGKALEDYVTLLREGPSSELNDDFAPDTYRERLFTAREVLTKAAKKAKGTYADTIEPDLEGAYVLQTADGGALVFAPLAVTSTFKVKGAKVSVPSSDQPLVNGKLTTQVAHHYLDFLVLHIPGPAADSNPGVVAADHQLIKVASK